MRIVIQRVKEASVAIDGIVHGEIQKGFLLFVGVSNEDNKDIAKKLADKIIHLRIFEDENGKMNLSLDQVDGAILSISQFTLFADCKKGNRPSFAKAGEPEHAKALYLWFNEYLRLNGVHVEEGIFAADMKVALINDGPVTIILDSDTM